MTPNDFNENPLRGPSNPYMGLEVMTNPNIPAMRPKLQVSPALKWITPEMRAQVDAYLLKRFGETQNILGTTYMGRPRLLCHPAVGAMLRREMERHA